MAGKQKTFNHNTLQKIESALDKLPEKPKSERLLTTKELVAELRSKIRAAQVKGYTLEEIVLQFKQAGAEVSLSTIKNAIKGLGVRRSKPSTSPKNKKGTEPGQQLIKTPTGMS